MSKYTIDPRYVDIDRRIKQDLMNFLCGEFIKLALEDQNCAGDMRGSH